jgi:excisionase family DNA binding protein
MFHGTIEWMPDEYLTVDQAGKLLQLNPQTVRRMLTMGKLPGRKLGAREWRISRTELDQFMKGEQKPKPPAEG